MMEVRPLERIAVGAPLRNIDSVSLPFMSFDQLFLRLYLPAKRFVDRFNGRQPRGKDRRESDEHAGKCAKAYPRAEQRDLTPSTGQDQVIVAINLIALRFLSFFELDKLFS